MALDVYSSSDNESTTDFPFDELVTYAIERAPAKFKNTINKYRQVLFSNSKLMKTTINTYANVVKCLKLLKLHIYKTVDSLTIVKYNLIESDIHNHIRKSFNDFV